MRHRGPKTLLIAIASILAGCSAMEENPKKSIQGLITTPATYYTTQKARYLGEKYKKNLDRLVELIVRNPKTANLQFANNIASVGGIGFFSHSATNSLDERFLEIIIGIPETFDAKMERSAKVQQVFSLYGPELLSILAGDPDIYQEREVSGYGLNLSWRNLVADASGSRVSLERTTLYFQKDMVRRFLRGDVSQPTFLGEAVIFAVVDDRPMQLVSYRPQESTADLRRPIQEEPLVAEAALAKPEAASNKVASPASTPNRPVTVKEQRQSSSQSLSQAKEKATELKGPSAFEEKVEDKATAVTGSSSASTEPPKSKELSSIVKIQEEILAMKQEPADQTSGAGLDQNTVVYPYVSPEVDLASLPVAPALPPALEAANVMASSKEQLKEQPMENGQQANAGSPEELIVLRAPKVLQGFVIQLAFEEMRDGRRWAETLEREGFSVSLTEAGGGSVRVRIGNFAGREEAEQHLQVLRRRGLKGIVLNLPQPYRPDVYPAVTEGSGNTLSAVQ